MKPTEEAYSQFQYLYDYFNRELFSDELPDCIITLQRTKKIRGYFSKSRFVAINNNKLVDEIALNPALFIVLPTKEIFQTMAHEMVHQWQFHFGKPSRSSYHNKECASKMESIGLMQSDTRREGGKKTGQNMGDYIIPGSAMDNASRKLLEDGFEIKWSDVIQAR